MKAARVDAQVSLDVQLEVTWRCNWRCVHCYQDDHSREVLSLERLNLLFQELEDLGTMHILVTGGEPLVRKDIFEILESIRNHGMGITLFSNGHLISNEVAERLGKLIAAAEVSVLAGNEELHDQLTRVRGSFSRTLQAIKALKQQGVTVTAKTSVLRPAYHTLRELEDRLMRLGVMWSATPEIFRTYAGNASPLQFQLNFQEKQRFYADFPQFRPQKAVNSKRQLGQRPCSAARNFCFIDALGNVYPCMNFKTACDALSLRTASRSVTMGNILETSFRMIWESAPLAERIRKAKYSDFSTCLGCSAFQHCNLCMALNYEENGNLFIPAKSICDLTKSACMQEEDLGADLNIDVIGRQPVQTPYLSELSGQRKPA